MSLGLIAPAPSPLGISMTDEVPLDDRPFPQHTLVIYDGICGLCNRLVVFLLRHDHKDCFRFAPLQSGFAKRVLRQHGLNPDDLDTVVVIAGFRQRHERALTRSDAVLWVAVQLGAIWKLLLILKIVPFSVRESIYRSIARRRYRLFGRYVQCPIPSAADRHKFLPEA